MTDSTKTEGSVVATLLNLSSTVEIEVYNALQNKTCSLFGSTSATYNQTSEGEAYTFGPIDMPNVLNDSMFGFLMFIHENSGAYLLNLSLNNKTTGETYCDYSSVITSSMFNNCEKLYKFKK